MHRHPKESWHQHSTTHQPLHDPSKVVASTVLGMGALTTDSKKNKPDSAEGDAGGESWSAPNGDGDRNGSDSVDANDTLFIKELRVKSQVRSRGGAQAGIGGPLGALCSSGLYICMYVSFAGRRVVFFLAGGMSSLWQSLGTMRIDAMRRHSIRLFLAYIP